MTKKTPDILEQHARFLETARALGCDEDEAAFDEKLKAVVGPKVKQANVLELRSPERTYSVEEAQAYSRAQIEYCDRMETQYVHANLALLRQAAHDFRIEAERKPLDRKRINAICSKLQADEGPEGSGWSSLLGYVMGFIKVNDAPG